MQKPDWIEVNFFDNFFFFLDQFPFSEKKAFNLRPGKLKAWAFIF